MKKTTRLLALLLSLLMVLSLTATAFAADDPVIASGGDGVNAKWTLTEGGVLTVSGNGPIVDEEEIEYDEDGEISSISKLDCIGWQISAVWDKVTENMPVADAARERFDFVKTIVIEEGITEIPDGEFDSFCPRTIRLPLSLQKLGSDAINARYCESLTIPNPELQIFAQIPVAGYSKDAKPYSSIDDAIDEQVAFEAKIAEISAKADILLYLETGYAIYKKVPTDVTKAEYLKDFNAVYGTKYTTVKDCILYCIKQVNALLGTNYTKAAQIVEIVSFDDEKFVQRKQEIYDKVDALYAPYSTEGRIDTIYLGSYDENLTAYQWLTVYAPAGSDAEESCKVNGVPFVSTTPIDNSPLGKIKAFFAKVKAFFEQIIAKLTAPFNTLKLILDSKLQKG